MDFDDHCSVIDVIIWEVAEARGMDPLQLETICSVVDPDALQAVLGESSDISKIEFNYGGCEVVVEDERDVHVFPKT